MERALDPTYLMTARAGPDFEDVEVGRPLMLQARERCVANCAGQMRLTFIDRRGVIGRGHRVLAEAGIIQLFDVHDDVSQNWPVRKDASPAPSDCETAGTALAQVLRQAVGDLVIVALLGDEDVHVETRPGRVVEGAHGDRDLVALHRFPEQG